MSEQLSKANKRALKKQKVDQQISKLATEYQIRKYTLYQLNIYYWLISPLKSINKISTLITERIQKFQKFEFIQQQSPSLPSSNGQIQQLGFLSKDNLTQLPKEQQPQIYKQFSIIINGYLKIEKQISSDEFKSWLKNTLKNYEYYFQQVLTFNRVAQKKIEEFTQQEKKLTAQINNEKNMNKVKEQEFLNNSNTLNYEINNLKVQIGNLENQKKNIEYQSQSNNEQYKYLNEKYSEETYQRCQRIKNGFSNDTSIKQILNYNQLLQNIMSNVQSNLSQHNSCRDYLKNNQRAESKRTFLDNYKIKYQSEQDKNNAYHDTSQSYQSGNNLKYINDILDSNLLKRQKYEEDNNKYIKEKADYFKGYFNYIKVANEIGDQKIDAQTKQNQLQADIDFINEQISNIHLQISDATEQIGVFDNSNSLKKIYKFQQQQSYLTNEINAIQSFILSQENIDNIKNIINIFSQLNSIQEKECNLLERFQYKSSPSYINFSDINKLFIDIIESSPKLDTILEFTEQVQSSYNNLYQILNTLKNLSSTVIILDKKMLPIHMSIKN